MVTAVPESERHSRDELVRIANMYFSGIELNDGKGVYPLHEACARLENGSVTAGDPALMPGAPPTSPESCSNELPPAVPVRRIFLRHAHSRPALRSDRS